MVSPAYGVRWIQNYAVADTPEGSPVDNFRSIGLGDIYPDVEVFGPGQHPFATKYATRFATMLIDPPVYLPAVLRDVLERGGTLTIREFARLEDVVSLPEPIVFNCTGLGARALFGDDGMLPMKGQLSMLLPQEDVDYITLGPDDLYMFPPARRYRAGRDARAQRVDARSRPGSREADRRGARGVLLRDAGARIANWRRGSGRRRALRRCPVRCAVC